MANTLVSQLITLLEGAFQGKDWNSLLTNLEAVTPADWRWVPPGGRRSICDIVGHVGACKYMYHSNAFGDQTLTWDHPLVMGQGALETKETAIEWLRAGHERLRGSIAALEDGELEKPRLHHSRGLQETRWIIGVMIEHDLYHAGEINYIRALHQGNDE
jgi:hypothetical protein